MNSESDPQRGLDIGPKSIELLQAEIGECQTIVWNGVNTSLDAQRVSNALPEHYLSLLPSHALVWFRPGWLGAPRRSRPLTPAAPGPTP